MLYLMPSQGTTSGWNPVRRDLVLRARLDLYQNNKLSVTAMDGLLGREYGLAVITIEEDRLLNKSARSKVSDTPEGRWKAAGIEFDGS